MKKNKKIIITSLAIGSLLSGATLALTLKSTINNSIDFKNNYLGIDSQRSKLIDNSSKYFVNDDQYKTINLLQKDGNIFTGNIITEYQQAFASTPKGFIIPTDQGLVLVDSSTLKIISSFNGNDTLGKTRNIIQTVYDEPTNKVLVVSQLKTNNSKVMVTALNADDLSNPKTLKLGDGNGSDQLNMSISDPFLFNIQNTTNSCYVLIPRGEGHLNTRKEQTYQFWLRSDNNDPFGNKTSNKPTNKTQLSRITSGFQGDDKTQIIQVGAILITSLLGANETVFVTLENDLSSSTIRNRVYYKTDCYQNDGLSYSGKYQSSAITSLKYINPHIILSYNTDTSNNTIGLKSVVNFNASAVEVGNIVYDCKFSIAYPQPFINNNFRNLQTSDSVSISHRYDYDLEVLNYSSKLNRIYGFSSYLASNNAGIVQFEDIEDISYGLSDFVYDNSEKVKILPLIDFANNKKQKVITLPSWDGNQYYSFVPSNGAKYTIYNTKSGINSTYVPYNYAPYAYNTTMQTNIDLSNYSTINSISVNDSNVKTNIETILNNSLNSNVVNDASFFNQYIIGSKATLEDIVRNTDNNSITATVSIYKAYLNGEITIKKFNNIKFLGFKPKLTILKGSASIASIDSNLVNKTWKDVTDVGAFKNKVVSYFDNGVKTLFNIPLGANITVDNVIDSKAPTGEVSFILNISKYIDSNNTEQSNGKFAFTIPDFAKYNSKVKVTANQVFNYGNEVDIATITEEQIKAFILEKVKAGEIFEGQFINKNSVSDLTADDLVITLNKDMNADSGKGQYTVTVSLKKEAAYNEGQQATQNLTTPSFIIKGFKLVETTMTSKKSFGYNELFSGDVPNLENFANGFDNTIKAMIVSKQTTLFENLPDGGIAEANINIVDSNIKDYATYASGELQIQFTLNKVRPSTVPSKTFEITITGFKKLKTTIKSTKSFPLGDSSKYANDPSINVAWVKNKIIENKDTIFENLPKKVLPDGTTNWDLSKFLTVSNLNSDSSNGEITFNVILNNVYATGSQISEKVTFAGFKTNGITTELKSKTIDATSSEFKSIFTDQLANAFKEDFEKNKEKVKTSLINYINKNINTFFNDPSDATTVNDLDFTYRNNTLVVNSVTYVGKKGSNDSATITALNVSAWQILNLKSNPTHDEVIGKIKNELTNKIKNDINNPPAKIISKDVLVDELVNVLNSLKMSTDTWVGFPQTYVPTSGNFDSNNININKDQIELPDFSSTNLKYIIPGFSVGSISVPQFYIEVNKPESSSTNATITEARNSPNVLAIVLGTLGGLVLLVLLILWIALSIKRRNKYYEQY